MRRLGPILLLLVIAVALAGLAVERRRSDQQQAESGSSAAGEYVAPGRIRVTDGDTIRITSGTGPSETIRILGIDAPEIRRRGVDGSMDQPFGPEARDFAARTFGAAKQVHIRRAPRPDRYGRTLAYLFVDHRNYSALIVANHLAEETVSHYGPQGFRAEADEVLEAARKAGKPPFDSPSDFRRLQISRPKSVERRP